MDSSLYRSHEFNRSNPIANQGVSLPLDVNFDRY